MKKYYILVVLLCVVPSMLFGESKSVRPSIPHRAIRLFNPIPGVDPSKYIPESIVQLENELNAVRVAAGSDLALMLELHSQAWDTTANAWYDQIFQSNTFNAAGDNIETVTKMGFTLGVPIQNSSRTVSTFNANHTVAQAISYNWSGSAWTEGGRSTYAYDDSSRVTKVVTENKTGSDWVPSRQQLYTYAWGSNTATVMIQSYSGGTWVNSNKLSYTYTAAGDVQEYVYASWASSAWKEMYRTTYTYDIARHNSTIVYQNGSTGTWVNQTRITYAWDGAGDNTEILYERWDGSAWVNSGKQVFGYDSNHHQTSWTNYNWVSSAWLPDMRQLSTFGANGMQTEVYVQMYGGPDNWLNQNYYAYTYDSHNNTTQLIVQMWNGAAWENSSRVMYTWQYITAGVDEAPALAAGYKLSANYPNPFNPTTTIAYTLGKAGQVTLTIHDMLGREVATLVNGMQTPGEHQVTWSAGNAASGMYYYTLSAGGFVISKPMMLVK